MHKMKTHTYHCRSRRFPINVTKLERRVLLSAAGAWVSQYVNPGDPTPFDYTDWTATAASDGIQDAHIALSSLPTNMTISYIDVNRIGGGDWWYNDPGQNGYAASLQNYGPSSTTGDLFFQPNYLIAPGGAGGADHGWQYVVYVYYVGKTTPDTIYMTDTYTYSRLLMPSEKFQVTWKGQDTPIVDDVGPDAGVGPDGIQDDHLALSSLAHFPGSSSSYPVNYVSVTGPAGTGLNYESNLNLDNYANAALVNLNGTSADLYINPYVKTGPTTTADLVQGQNLTVTVHYSIEGFDIPDQQTLTVGATNPSLAVPPPPNVSVNMSPAWTATWGGQDPASSGGQAYVSLANLPGMILGAELSDQVSQVWSWGTLGGNSLSVSQGQNSPLATLSFSPVGNEAWHGVDATMTLRLDFGGGNVSGTQFPAGATDPGLTVPNIPSDPAVPAYPIDGPTLLQAIKNGASTVYLNPADTYDLNQQLVLNNPITITSVSSAQPTLTFTQPQSGSLVLWDFLIQINASHVTLNGLKIRISGPVFWDWTSNDQYGPSVIKQGTGGLRSVQLTNLDIQGPTEDPYEESYTSTESFSYPGYSMTGPGLSGLPQFPLFNDNFSGSTIGTWWTNVGNQGNWSQNQTSSGDYLEQNNTSSSNNEVMLLNSPSSFPTDMEMVAEVTMTSALSGDGRVGIGLNTDSSGNGYKLVFHNVGGSTVLQLLDDGVQWSSPVASYVDYQGNSHPWTVGITYYFKLLVMKSPLSGQDTLYGKVWASTDPEPTAWSITQTGWSHAAGAPALEGGGGGGGSAEFQNVVAVALAPSGLSTVFSDSFGGSGSVGSTSVGGSWTNPSGDEGQWSQASGTLSQNNASSGAYNKYLLVSSQESLSGNMQITALVQVASALTGDAHVGVGLNGDGDGNGYSLVFRNVGSSQYVQILYNGTEVQQATYSWSSSSSYYFTLLVMRDPNGVATAYGKVWLDGTAEPSDWTLFWTGGMLTTGSPFLDGGSASFQQVFVTTPVAPAVSLIVLPFGVYGGTISGCTLAGGNIQITGGDWTVSGNVSDGALPGTSSQSFLSTYDYIFDLDMLNNQVRQLDPTGQLFRLFNAGGTLAAAAELTIQGNTVVDGMGMGDYTGDLTYSAGSNDQSYSWGPPNSPEFILAEGYNPLYEGKPAFVSTDGRVLQINPYGLSLPFTVGPGDFVSIITSSDPNAGHYYRIAQVINSDTFLMDQPLPTGGNYNYVINIGSGYSNLTIGGSLTGQGNTVDILGSMSDPFKLNNYEYGTAVVGNHFIGGGSFDIQSATTGSNGPFPGWTHTSMHGIAVDDNVFEDQSSPGLIAVQHTSTTESDAGRLYWQGQMIGNIFEYDSPQGSSITAVSIGNNEYTAGVYQGNNSATPGDPSELSLTTSTLVNGVSTESNTIQVPSSFTQGGGTVVLGIVEGTVDGIATSGSTFQASRTITLTSSGSSPQVNLSPAFNQVGISTDNGAQYANFDGNNDSYSINAIDANTLTWNGQVFNLGSVAMNDIDALGGQTIAVPQGNYTNVMFLASSIRGAQPVVIQVNYTDGSHDTFNQDVSDWIGGYTGGDTTAPGESIVKTMNYYNYWNGSARVQVNTPNYIYGYSLAVNPAKTVASVAFTSNNVNTKLFALDVVNAPGQVNLNAAPNGSSTAFWQVGISADNGAQYANFDGSNDSYSINAIGANTLTWNGQVFNLGSVAMNDIDALGGQTIAVPQGNYTNVMFLASSIRGAQPAVIQVNYTDSSHDTFNQVVSDWIGGYTGGDTTAPGESIVKTMNYYNYWNGSARVQENTSNYIYGYSLAVNPAKTVASVAFTSNNVNTKLFALDVVNAPGQVNLNAAPNGSSTAFWQVGISADNGAQYANLDGSNHSYSAKALSNTIAWNSQVFILGSAMINDVAKGTGQTVALPSGNFNRLFLLGAATNGVQWNQTFLVNYSDGTHDTFTQTVSDWVTGYTGTGGTTAPGESIAAIPNYYNYWNGSTSSQINTKNYVYGYSFAVNSAKVIASIALPSDGNVKILAIDETYKGGSPKPALASGGPHSGPLSSTVGPVPSPTSVALVGTTSDAMSAPLPWGVADSSANTLVSIRLPVSSTSGLPTFSDVTVDYSVQPGPPATVAATNPSGYSVGTLLFDSRCRGGQRRVLVS